MATTTLIIARHGNTFGKGETPKRVGARTDLPLVEEERSRFIGRYLKKNDLIPQEVFASPLKRTIRTAQLAMEEMDLKQEIILLHEFTEIDYGPDENKTEEEVFWRLGNGDSEKGKEVIEAWNRQGIVPVGWIVDPEKIVKDWFQWAESRVNKKGENACSLIVTSNGIIRFAPYLTGDFEYFAKNNDIKASTGSIAVFEKKEKEHFWNCKAWNVKPSSQ
jgi:probable phosphoglycerate mutase